MKICLLFSLRALCLCALCAKSSSGMQVRYRLVPPTQTNGRDTTAQPQDARAAPQLSLVGAGRPPVVRAPLAHEADGVRGGGLRGQAGHRDPEYVVGPQ